MCQLEKLQTNEITESPAFTVFKLELCRKTIVLQSHSRCINYTQNEQTCFAKKETNQGASATAQVQGGTSFSRGQQRTK